MVVYSDELCHGIRGWTKPGHKYIKREWKNGHWRYYYSAKPDNNIKETIRRVSGQTAKEYANEKIRDYNRAKANSEGYSKIQTDPTRQKFYNESKEKALRDDAAAKGALANKAIRDYYKTPLGQVQKAKDAIETGRNKVADILANASEKVRPSKSKYF